MAEHEDSILGEDMGKAAAEYSSLGTEESEVEVKSPEQLGVEMAQRADDLLARAKAVEPEFRTDDDKFGFSVGTIDTYGSSGKGADVIRAGDRIGNNSHPGSELTDVIRWREATDRDSEPGELTGAYSITDLSGDRGATVFIDARGGKKSLREGVSNSGDLQRAQTVATEQLDKVRQAIEAAEERQRAAKSEEQ